jgi:hypothetical protein
MHFLQSVHLNELMIDHKKVNAILFLKGAQIPKKKLYMKGA